MLKLIKSTLLLLLLVPACSEKPAIEFYNNGGDALQAGRYADAIKLYTKAIQLEPDYTYAFNDRGYAYSCLKDYQNAIHDYDKAIAFKPDYVLAFANRGDAYLGLKNYENALRDYAKVIALKPDYAEAF